MTQFFLFILLAAVPSLAASPIQLSSNGKITGFAHLSPASVPRIEVLVTEDCSTFVLSPAELQLKPGCKFLRGYFKYEYKDAGDLRLRVTPFSVLWNASGSHVLLVAESMDLLPRK